MSHLVGGVSSADQMPCETIARTLEQSPTATWSDSASTDTKPEVAETPKPEVARKQVIIQQPTTMAPISQICAGSGILFPLSDQSHEGTDNRPTVILYPAMAVSGNTNIHDVTNRSVEVKSYIIKTKNCKTRVPFMYHNFLIIKTAHR